MASQPPSASTPTWPSAGTDCRAGLYRAISRTARTRDAYSSRLACSRRLVSWSSWPKPLTTRTPVTAPSTTPATAAACCCASQLAGNSLRRDATEMNHSAGPTASAIRVSVGESTAMMASDTTNSTALPSSIGTMLSNACTMDRSEMDRLTTWPVCSSSCRAPSSRDSAWNISVRRSCCTSRDSRPARYRRRYSPAKLITAAAASATASGHTTGCPGPTRSSTICRWMSGMIALTPVTTSVPARASSVVRG